MTSIIRGTCAHTLSSLSPSFHPRDEGWLVPVLIKMMYMTSVEQFGAMSLLCCTSMVDERVVKGMCWVLQKTYSSSTHHQLHTKKQMGEKESGGKEMEKEEKGMVYRVSIWRMCLVYFSQSSMVHGRIRRGRRWCASQNVIESVLGILKYLDDSVKVVDGKGTVFSGPGVFRQSGFSVHDCAYIVRSVVYFLRRIAVVRDSVRGYLIHRGELIGWCKRLGAVFEGDDAVREDLVQFLMSLGIGSPMAQFPIQSIKQMLVSQTPQTVLRGLKILARSGELIDAECLETFITQQQGAAVLLSLIDPAHQYPPTFNELCGPNVKIQRDPLRDATTLAPNLTWRMIVRSMAMHVVGRLWKNGCMSVIRFSWKNAPWLVDYLGRVIKKGNDLERWGAVSLLDAVFTSSRFYNCSQSLNQNCQLDITSVSFAFVLIKMLKHPLTTKHRTTVLDSMHDLQWRFEFWTSSINILSIMIQFSLLDLTSAHQAGLVPSLFLVLDFVQKVHAEAPPSNMIRKKQHVETRYSLDDTLPDLIHATMKMLCDLSSDKLTRDIILWDTHVGLLIQYVSFFDDECCEVLRNLIELVTTSVPSNSGNEVIVATLKMHLTQSPEETWPPRSNNQLDPIRVLETQPELYPFAFSKQCRNCRSEESRSDQFLNCGKCKPIAWYCSRACMIADKKKHVRECLGNTRINVQQVE